LALSNSANPFPSIVPEQSVLDEPHERRHGMKSQPKTLARALALFLLMLGTSAGAASSRFTPSAPGTSMKVDQVNAAKWDKAWTNLVNDAEQTFVPSLPRLLAVEVGLIVGNPGPAEDELTLTVMDSKGQTVAAVTRTVQTSDCDHTLFVISKDGIDVTPGEMYRLKLTGGTLFGWKYVLGGYKDGAATFNGKPLLPKARTTFLFRTFGED
jgi:hypothetical protein